MIVLGHIEHPQWLITVLKTNKRITLQIEYAHHVLSYKFLDGSEVQDRSTAEAWLTLSRKRKIQAIFEQMQALRTRPKSEENELPDIF